MERSVVEGAATANQMCGKGAIRGNIRMFDEAFGGYQIKDGDMQVNLLTIDLEDWHQAYHIRYSGENNSQVSSFFESQVDALLELLDATSIKATFFCLGKTAEKKPRIIEKVASIGHEIQSHGYGHQRVWDQGPVKFVEDIKRAKMILEDIIGKEVIGYRAPEFSITRQSSWAFTALTQAGYAYDSSVFPCMTRRYGWPGFPEEPTQIVLENGATLVEMPLLVIDLSSFKIPFAGGGYFRLAPAFLIYHLLARDDKNSRTFYFHPYEFGKDYLNVCDNDMSIGLSLSLRINLSQNLFRSTITNKVRALLHQQSFMTIGGYLEQAKPRSSILFSSIS